MTKTRWNLSRRFALASYLLLLLGGCLSQVTSENKRDDLGAFDAAQREGSGSDYRIGPEDTIQVTVFQTPDLNRTLQVSASGVVTMPLINQVRVTGLTVDQAAELIAKRLSQKYLRSPQVSVAMVKSGKKVTVSGSITTGVINMEGRLTLSQAIALRGGVNSVGNSSRIHIARVQGQQVQDDIYSLDDITSGKIPDPELQGGDMIIVEDSKVKVALNTIKDLLPFAVLGSLAASDYRLKRDIVFLSFLENNLALYRFKYLDDDTQYVGVIAQEVALRYPEAVRKDSLGYLRVDYNRIGVSFQTYDEWRKHQNLRAAGAG